MWIYDDPKQADLAWRVARSTLLIFVEKTDMLFQLMKYRKQCSICDRGSVLVGKAREVIVVAATPRAVYGVAFIK